MGVINIVASLVYAKKTKEKIENEKKKKKKPIKKKVKSIRDIKINHGLGSLEDKL